MIDIRKQEAVLVELRVVCCMSLYLLWFAVVRSDKTRLAEMILK